MRLQASRPFMSKKDDQEQDVSGVKRAESSFRSIFVSSPTQIWRSKVSWRIALTAFMTILLVQTVSLNIGGIENYRQERLESLKQEARSAIAATIDAGKRDLRKPPFSDEQVDRLLRVSNVTGLSVYSYQFEFIKSYGNFPHLIASLDTTEDVYMADDLSAYEVIFKGSDLRTTHIIVAQIDSASVAKDVNTYVLSTIKIMVILSLLVTVVLMIALGKWLLEPILFIRTNLIAAFKNPENPDIKPSPFFKNDEIGSAIDLLQKLIAQNAKNLTNLKSTAEDKIHKLAYYDNLTGLPNRALFLNILEEKSRANSDGEIERFAVITLDLDHFKDVNDSMGHNVGDAILRAVGKRLRASLPEAATVSRTGEDEYAVMMPLGENIKARDVAERALGVIRSEPFKVFNEEFQIRASVGVSRFPDDGIEPDAVLKNADIALNRAKEEGRDTIKEYSEDFDRAVQERFQMLRDLRDAMEHDQLQLHFQPQLCLNTSKVIGAEALLRWWKPDNGKDGGSFISPAVFVPVAEQSGLIVPIGQWVLNKACKTAQEFKEEHGIHIRFAINVSGTQFVHGDICGDVSKALKETGIDPKMIELEVTESVFMDDINHTVRILNELHRIGVELAIDDFGTGYSSLSYLSHFPIDRLKIDQSFIRNALSNKEDASIAKTIISLGHSLDLKVIAEGVETKDHETFLKSHKCDEVQGFRYCRPVPADKLLAFIKNYDGNLDSFKA
ncbi:MAG: EAL domain-containing protein [Alphaproteobacteria bacterium]|nr:EAL domain-containing protein [Alphaproteobacteria bacterium]